MPQTEIADIAGKFSRMQPEMKQALFAVIDRNEHLFNKHDRSTIRALREAEQPRKLGTSDYLLAGLSGVGGIAAAIDPEGAAGGIGALAAGVGVGALEGRDARFNERRDIRLGSELDRADRRFEQESGSLSDAIDQVVSLRQLEPPQIDEHTRLMQELEARKVMAQIEEIESKAEKNRLGKTKELPNVAAETRTRLADRLSGFSTREKRASDLAIQGFGSEFTETKPTLSNIFERERVPFLGQEGFEDPPRAADSIRGVLGLERPAEPPQRVDALSPAFDSRQFLDENLRLNTGESIFSQADTTDIGQQFRELVKSYLAGEIDKARFERWAEHLVNQAQNAGN